MIDWLLNRFYWTRDIILMCMLDNIYPEGNWKVDVVGNCGIVSGG